VTESVYTTQTPGSVNNDDGSGIVLGMVWKAGVDGSVVGGRVYVGTKPTTLKMGLYSISDESTGAQLKAVDFVMGSVNNNAWNSVLFATPYAYTANTNLVILYYSSDRYSFLSGMFNSAVVSGNLTGLQKGVPLANGRFLEPATDLAFPTGNGNGAGYFADVLFNATGAGGVDGVVSGTLGSVTGALAGQVPTIGVVGGSMGSATGTVVGNTPAPVVTTHMPVPGWYGYLNIVREAGALAAAERTTAPIACPHDGEPLRSKDGILWCPFDGYRYPS
jgi:hypothetical protein